MSGFGGHGDDAVDRSDGLTPRQAKAVEAMLQEPTMARAAAVAGANERTLRRWLEQPAFRNALFRVRRDAFGQAIWLTQRYAAVAVATLLKVMQDAAAPPSSKVSAAGMVLKFGREGIELDDLAERIESLERSAAGKGTPPASSASRPRWHGPSKEDEEDEL